MRLFSGALALVAAVALCGSALAADPQYKKIKEIVVGGAGGYDYLNADAENQRLYVTHATKVVVIDTKEDKVIGEIANLRGVHGFAVAPDLKRGFASNGQGDNVSVIDLESKDDAGKPTFKELMTVKTAANPDAIMYIPKIGEVWTSNGRNTSNSFTAFDAKTGKVLAESVALGGKPETAQFDVDLNRVFVNVETKNEVVEVDIKEHKVLNHWPLGSATAPTGMAIVPEFKRIVVGASKMVLMDYTNGKVVATLDCGAGVDAAAYDPGTHLAFVSAGAAGTVTVAKVEADKLTLVQTLTTERQARTMAVDTKTHRIYLSSPGTGTNGFKVLVYGIDEATATTPAKP